MDHQSIQNTRELILIMTGSIGLITVLGSVGFWLLKKTFTLKSECNLMQDKCHQKICKKIDEIKDILKANSIAYNLEQQLLLKRSNAIDINFQRMVDKLNRIQPENPIVLKEMPNPQ